jgi:beta-lactamase class A
VSELFRPWWKFPPLAVALLLTILSAGAADAQPAHRALLRAKLQRDLQHLADEYRGVVGIRVVDLTDSTTIGVNDTLTFPQGSAIKIPILIELFRQADARPALLREQIPMTAAARTGGSGVLQDFTDGGSQLSVEDLAILMIRLSDNTATNLLIDKVGMPEVNRMLDGLGARHTRLQRKMIRADAMLKGEENISTPTDAANVMTMLARCALPLTKASCARVRAILEMDKDEPVRSAIPSDVRVASKPGDIEGVSTSWALVDLPDRPFVLTMMTNYGDSDAGKALIQRAATMVYEHFTRLARSTPNGARVPIEVIRRNPDARRP